MGDVLTLIEKAQNAFSEEEALALTKKLKEKTFTLQDYLNQLDSVKKMGNLKDMLKLIPGMGKQLANADIDESKIARTKAIIQSMTPYERAHPEILKASRRKRIATGSGTSIQEVNQMLKQFEMSREMMKQMSGGGAKRFMRGGFPGMK